jgi:hypothetical protein
MLCARNITAVGGSGAEVSDGRWGRNGATGERASPPGDGRWWGRASDSAEAGGGGNIYGVSGGLHIVPFR